MLVTKCTYTLSCRRKFCDIFCHIFRYILKKKSPLLTFVECCPLIKSVGFMVQYVWYEEGESGGGGGDPENREIFC